ncbi:MAG: thiolase family protein, partial [Planctomycetota bacterium]
MSIRKPLAVVAGRRTPMAKAFTKLADVNAVTLGTHAVNATVQEAAKQADRLSISEIDELVMGNVAGPPDAANIARVIALTAGMPDSRVAHTVNRNCASGMESILSAWDSIESGRSNLVIAGGTESMSDIPMLFHQDAAKVWMRLARSKTMMQKLRCLAAFRPKHFKPVIGVQLGLTDPVSGLNMGQTAEVLAKEFSISRDEQDAFAVESHRRAAEARERCFLSGEVAPIENRMEKDNGPREQQSMEQLARLRPIFEKGGTVTPGNSCPLTDGAATLLLTDLDHGKRFAEPLGYITHLSVAGCDPRRMGLGPVYATAKLLRETGYSLNDFDLIELNEAFAAQVIACKRAFESTEFARKELDRDRPLGTIDERKLNPNGGAIALGHP